MFLLNVKAHYDAAHFLRNYHGKCERMHGHRYVVELALTTNDLDEAGIAFDFVHVKKHLRDVADRLGQPRVELGRPEVLVDARENVAQEVERGDRVLLTCDRL